MKKLDYLKLALNKEKYVTKKWLLSLFTVYEIDELNPEYLDLKMDATGHYYYDGNNYVKLEDGIPNTPLFSHNDEIQIDNSWCPNLHENIESTIGNLIFNWVVLVYAFGNKITYATGKVDIGDIETELVKRFADQEEINDPSKIYPREYDKFVEGNLLLSSLSTLFVWAATEKNITSAPGMYEYKDKLIKEYGDKLKDPVVFAEFESKLKKLDDDYLADDPSNGVIMSGRVKNVARKRLAITAGIESGLTPTDSNPILNSLEQGWDNDPENMVVRLNVSRAASYSRGKETQKGGEVQKIILRTASNFRIVGENCGTGKGITRTITKEMKMPYLNRYIIGYITDAGEVMLWKMKPILLTEENYEQYLDKTVIMRSVGYCLNEGDTVCNTCAGANYKEGESTTLTLTDISHMILMSRMKAMHGIALTTKKLVLKDVLS